MSVIFEFVKSINSSYYEALEKIERVVRIRPQEAARDSRVLLEHIVNDMLRENNIEPAIELSANLKIWRRDKNLKYPFNIQVDFDSVDGNSQIHHEKLDGFTFIRQLGNNEAHAEDCYGFNGTRPIMSTDSVILALKVFYKYFKQICKDTTVKIEPFIKKNIPLGDYKIEKMYTPADSERSQCIREYVVSRNKGAFTHNKVFALVREYNPQGMDEMFLMRNIDAFEETYGSAYSSGVQVSTLNHRDDKNANFFVVYEFRQNFVSLEEFLNKRISISERISICKQIAEAFVLFHTAPNPVYHRMLTFECIVITCPENEANQYRPYVTKFDFAKITSIKEGTVFKQLSEAQLEENLKVSRYKIDNLSPDSKWDKVDIYSLGVLFVDILMNKITTHEINKNTFDMLASEGVSDSMLDLIDSMLSQIPEGRPSISEVCDVITKESMIYE